ncbi:MAG: ComEA family DNA-binding protein [Alicyclobacillaceae bacterium]|nr:ComEA family DNA-binding protein [Alicyclobacillaceae bacterium]
MTLGRDDSARKIAVDVKGAVRAPGVYHLPVGARVQEAVEAAGGALDSAGLDGINLAAKLEDGSMVVVPRRPVQDATGRGPALSEQNLSGERGANVEDSGDVVHLNSAKAEDIDRLPGIGRSKAEAIVKFREEHGPFSSVDKLEEVPGIGPKLVERIRNQVDLQ